MSEEQNKNRERSFIVVGPNGQHMRMQGSYQDPENWQTVETDAALLLMARPQETGDRRDLLGRICAYVDENLSRKVTLREVAEKFEVSVSTVTQLFQRKSDITFHQHLTLRRMEMAKQLIHDRVPLEEVGKLVGYVDHSTFYRAFRQTFGLSPREYRKKQNL